MGFFEDRKNTPEVKLLEEILDAVRQQLNCCRAGNQMDRIQHAEIILELKQIQAQLDGISKLLKPNVAKSATLKLTAIA